MKLKDCFGSLYFMRTNSNRQRNIFCRNACKITHPTILVRAKAARDYLKIHAIVNMNFIFCKKGEASPYAATSLKDVLAARL